ncbi:MAG TPA: SRPBCC domain-containing protein [Streptosporangiaceae bacterium]|nr:SRPBCC domain-containing protein [Streptosporangiaceae bacterium]
MSKSIVLAFDVAASPACVYHILTTTEGQSAFWTGDCDVRTGHARFNFPGESPVEVDITTQPERLVRMNAASGVTHGATMTWEYELHPAEAGTTVVFREYGFPEDYSEIDLGRITQTWARIMDRLVSYAATGTPRPFFPCHREERPA